MSLPLLSTKLFPPPVRSDWIGRPRLHSVLEQRFNRRLTLVSAPVGSGKTAIVSQWLAQSWHVHAWLSLERADNDLTRFLTYLIAALQPIAEHIGETLAEAMTSGPPPSVETLGTLLVNDLARLPQDSVVVLDDFHEIDNPAVLSLVQFLLERKPSRCHVVIITRRDPPFPLARWRASDDLNELREHDLRFMSEETSAFLNGTMALDLPADAVEALEQRTEGWIASLQLAALSLRHQPDPSAFIASFSGSHRYIADYLTAEVLWRQPEPIQHFLRQTCILDRLTASLCDAVTGQNDSAELLLRLEQANLFLIPLDDQRQWYRYHPLFAEALRATLLPADAAVLHNQAAAWYGAHDLTEPAIRHALACGSLAGAWDAAERLIAAACEPMIQRGLVHSVRHWLDALPDERIRAHADLAAYFAWALAIDNQFDRAEAYARIAAAGLSSTGDQTRLLLVRCFLALGHGDYAGVIEAATQALDALADDEPQRQIIALWMLAEAQERTRPLDEAIATFRVARQVGSRLHNQLFAVLIEASLASILYYHGQRREAVVVCETALRHSLETNRLEPFAGILLNWLALFEYDADQLEQAQTHVERALALNQQLGIEGLIVFSQGVAARIEAAQGKAEAALERLRPFQRPAPVEALDDNQWLFALEATLRLRQGSVDLARRWAERAGFPDRNVAQYLRFEEHLTYARLLLAQGRLPEARERLDDLAQLARQQGFVRWLISVHILQALAAAQDGDHAAAHSPLAQAVDIAASEGYARAFLDDGPQVHALLPAVRDVAPAFVDHLLARHDPTPMTERAAHPDALSERELEVLRLMEAGLTNAEIAGRLVITTGTVKRHVHTILEKLGASNRTQAVTSAREAGMLTDRPHPRPLSPKGEG